MALNKFVNYLKLDSIFSLYIENCSNNLKFYIIQFFFNENVCMLNQS